MALNKGEWSEIYTILYLLLNPDINIVNDMLASIEDGLYSIKEIDTVEENPTKYILDKFNNVNVYKNDVKKLELKKTDLKLSVEELLAGIKKSPKTKGAFEITDTNFNLRKILEENKVKSSSFSKSDLIATVFDNNILLNVVLNYSVKSSLGNPPTMLNASKHTNFIYEVKGLNSADIETINNINMGSKLKDRISKIIELGGKIKFYKVQSEDFEYNLKMIDTLMPHYLANTLLSSYKTGNKNLKQQFLESNNFKDEDIAMKKLGDLLVGISFGFFPSVKWDGNNEINGGLLLVKKDGSIVMLDLVYYKTYVIQYLLNETKLDSPSSSRYKMLELYNKNGKIYFTLNIQIRYKS